MNESNVRHASYKEAALPTELTRRECRWWPGTLRLAVLWLLRQCPWLHMAAPSCTPSWIYTNTLGGDPPPLVKAIGVHDGSGPCTRMVCQPLRCSDGVELRRHRPVFKRPFTTSQSGFALAFTIRRQYIAAQALCNRLPPQVAELGCSAEQWWRAPAALWVQRGVAVEPASLSVAEMRPPAVIGLPVADAAFLALAPAPVAHRHRPE